MISSAMENRTALAIVAFTSTDPEVRFCLRHSHGNNWRNRPAAMLGRDAGTRARRLPLVSRRGRRILRSEFGLPLRGLVAAAAAAGSMSSNVSSNCMFASPSLKPSNASPLCPWAVPKKSASPRPSGSCSSTAGASGGACKGSAALLPDGCCSGGYGRVLPVQLAQLGSQVDRGPRSR